VEEREKEIDRYIERERERERERVKPLDYDTLSLEKIICCLIKSIRVKVRVRVRLRATVRATIRV
jgi:hypothetical protein